ncbi:MAG: isoprenylcysteine carboxylmethyltransferase family protein [Casimicrobiaceae bacterium]
MQALELKIPPPIVALLVAIAMWGLAAWSTRVTAFTEARHVVALVLGISGAALTVSGALAFRRARTTTSPLKPSTATSLVTSGVFRFSRNPMYAGLGVVLLAFAIFLGSMWALLGPVAFILYMNRFQIEPEERALSNLFGSAFGDYQRRVRRWL